MKVLAPIKEPQVLRDALRDVLESHACAAKWPAKIDFDYLAKSLTGNRATIVGSWNGEHWDGIIAWFVAPDLHSGELWGYEWIWVVREDADSRVGDLLRQCFETNCRSTGCQRVVMGMFLGASRSDAAMRRKYRMKGYRPMSESFIKEL